MKEDPQPPSRPRIYLAGPDVFRPDARDHFVRLAAACEALGLAALLPADGNEELSAEAPEKRIYEANMLRLRGADGVVANLACFRGLEPDSGTVFEVGAAVALGIPVASTAFRKAAMRTAPGPPCHARSIRPACCAKTAAALRSRTSDSR
ncbi:nucleoside 2-deoxyribosyltransferase [Variovorax sp. S2]|uniref:nucleoside 2-deoxyribosyltransferase n=1 Tax=Variovorax sp. S12S4 TaxID=3029170 RepID=UPI00215C52A8|nr:nucleoside 2-deoxyribosyltransferase [Variovorax sp. S12S4]MCR8956219.1 nucleoside 2-deoxyribosyltransferase [Variovorax sp. S12S4]